MLINAKEISEEKTIEADLCIVGSGPAGLAIAKELANSGFNICLIESGDIGEEEAYQELCEGQVTSTDNYPTDVLTEARRRQVGGTANAWDIQLGSQDCGARLMPLDAIDFEYKDWVPFSGWPFSKTELDPYYARAHTLCQIGPYTYEAEAWGREARLPLTSDRLEEGVIQVGSQRPFTKELIGEFANSETISLYYNLAILQLRCPTNTLESLDAQVLGGPKLHIKAKVFVLAASCYENARLLLLSNQNHPTGIGNEHDLVGRYYMDHPSFSLGMWQPSSSAWDWMGRCDLRSIHKVPVMGRLKVTDQLIRQEKVLNLGAVLYPRCRGYRPKLTTLFQSLSTQSLRQKVGSFTAAIAETTSILYAKLFKLSYNSKRSGWSQRKDTRQIFRHFELIAQVEQIPHPDNRLTLEKAVDAFGQRKINLQWGWHHADLASIRKVQAVFKSEIEAAGLGSFMPSPHVMAQPLTKFTSTHHPMGTTRMHSNPEQGVVDADCRIHSVDNLFIAGSSVFPTGGYANPTLTVLALALRLADHLREQPSLFVEQPTPAEVGVVKVGQFLPAAHP